MVGNDHPILSVLALGLAGFGLGFGLVCGAFVARALRRYMEAEDMKPYDAAARPPRELRSDDEQ